MDWATLLTPNLGATGLLAVVVVLILMGRLVPRSSLDDLRTDKDKQIETWRSAYEKIMAAQDVQREQINTLLDAAKTTTNVIQALPLAPNSNERSAPRALAEEER